MVQTPRFTVALTALVLGSFSLGAQDARGTAPRPNIVFVLVDDLGWGDLSCYGQENWKTPNLDRMAAEGLRFTDAYAGSTVCAPSRAALLTGMHTGHLHQRGNGRVQFRRDPEDVTLATRLRALGYATAMIGKSGLACNSDDAALPADKGFDYFYGLLSHTAAHRQYPKVVYRNGERIELEGNEGKTGTQYGSELFVEDALRWIGALPAPGDDGYRPFFLHLSLTPVHADLSVPDRFVEPFRGLWEETPVTRGGYFHQPEPKATFAGMVAFLDDAMGRLFAKLEALGIDDDTFVFFASDNGPHYEGGAHADTFDSNGPFRGGKRALFEGGIRTPQLVRWPAAIEPGQVSDLPTAFWDFAPTALDLAGGAVPDGMDGISLMATLTGRGDQARHEFLYWEFHEQGGKQAVRMGRWKGIRRKCKQSLDGPIELYDLENDIGEQHDVAAEHPEVAARVAQIMAREHGPSERFSFGPGRER